MKTNLQRPFHVAVHGLPHFCQKLSRLVDGDDWDVPYRSPFHPLGLAARFADLARCDLAYSWTGRVSMGKFLRIARSLGKTKIIMLWCGSDALFARNELAEGKLDPWVANRVHWAVSPWLAQEVRELGIACEYVQASFVESIGPVPLPKNFCVLAYAPSLKKGHLYGLDLILQAARRLPSMKFTLVGLEEGKIPEAPPNLEAFSRLDLAPFYDQATVLWRPVRHDGLSFMVLEALARGRHVLYSYPLSGCIKVAGAEMACEQLERLRELHESGQLEPNEIGRQYVASEYDPQKVRAEILSRWKDLILSPESELRKSGVLETP